MLLTELRHFVLGVFCQVDSEPIYLLRGKTGRMQKHCSEFITSNISRNWLRFFLQFSAISEKNLNTNVKRKPARLYMHVHCSSLALF